MSKLPGAELQQSIPHDTEADMNTMNQAASVAADPTRLKKVHKLAGRKHKVLMGMVEPMLKKPKIKSLDELKAHANSYGSGQAAASDDDEMD